MATNSSVLWLVGLILCCCWSQINSMAVKMIKSPEAFNTRVELKCETSDADTGVYWIFQQNGHTMRFIVYVSVRGKVSPESINGYAANKNGNYYHLIITSFQEEDQGIYYCLVHRNQKLIFSSGLSVYLPKTTTQPPTVPHQITTRSIGQAEKEPMECPNPTASDEDLRTMFSCELYIWAPLVGGCFILLISLVITISVCCDPRRRRRCKCKRPMNGANGSLPLPRKNP
ncbi:T-cell surface glycoprotein CD8 alpha chain [Sceloporus undulatus]|uniref:T-cell surface glycoprotein CD8 alpha chain n=1 Tax=Sceloporus undulatus TaxID=8520 RepID=UPI001C4D7FA2|nr:T-cell surface glycoprotein CD8 alpha chain [Sceloporus undulatus]